MNNNLSDVDMERMGVTVIGGANIDIKGKPKNVIQWATSNPGTVQVVHGGVGRNVAHYLGLLNIAVTFLGAVGDDDEGREILERLRNARVQTGEVIQSKKDPTGKYVAILDEKGEMRIAVNDMAIMKRVTPRYLIAKAGLIKKSRLVIIDTNLTTQAIHSLADLCHREHIPFIVDPISVVKSRKLLGILPKIDYLVPNLNELASLTGMSILTSADRKKAAQKLIHKGIKNIILTLGSQGVYIFAPQFPEGELINIRKRKMVDCTGAGDALVAGIAYGLYHHYPLLKAIQIGMLLSSLTVQSPESVYSQINERFVKKMMIRMFNIL